jgi:hypothetical protein
MNITVYLHEDIGPDNLVNCPNCLDVNEIETKLDINKSFMRCHKCNSKYERFFTLRAYRLVKIEQIRYDKKY